jgi:nitroreductase/dihydropteridine reductase
MYSYFGTDDNSNKEQTSSFLSNIEWRRAVKHFGSDVVDTSDVIKAIVNAPSSFGLQPYRVIAVRNSELKKKLYEVSFNQSQITECDTLFVFCARTDIEVRAEEYLKATGMEGLREMLFGFLSSISNKGSWAARQAYIALGFGLAACAEKKIPSCPMEGFIPDEVKRILSLPDTLIPCVFLAVGSASENNETWPRFRFPKSDLIEERN